MSPPSRSKYTRLIHVSNSRVYRPAKKQSHTTTAHCDYIHQNIEPSALIVAIVDKIIISIHESVTGVEEEQHQEKTATQHKSIH